MKHSFSYVILIERLFQKHFNELILKMKNFYEIEYFRSSKNLLVNNVKINKQILNVFFSWPS